MKKIIIAIISLSLIGCSMIQLRPDAEMILIKAAARTAGYKYAANNQALVRPTIAYAKTLEELANSTLADREKLITDIFPLAVNTLRKNVTDPVVRLSILDATGLLQLGVPNVSIGTQTEQIRYIIQGFIEGVEMGR